MRFYIATWPGQESEIVDLDKMPDDDNEEDCIIDPSNLVGFKITKCYKDEVGDIIFEGYFL